MALGHGGAARCRRHSDRLGRRRSRCARLIYVGTHFAPSQRATPCVTARECVIDGRATKQLHDPRDGVLRGNAGELVVGGPEILSRREIYERVAAVAQRYVRFISAGSCSRESARRARRRCIRASRSLADPHAGSRVTT